VRYDDVTHNGSPKALANAWLIRLNADEAPAWSIMPGASHSGHSALIGSWPLL